MLPISRNRRHHRILGSTVACHRRAGGYRQQRQNRQQAGDGMGGAAEPNPGPAHGGGRDASRHHPGRVKRRPVPGDLPHRRAAPWLRHIPLVGPADGAGPGQYAPGHLGARRAERPGKLVQPGTQHCCAALGSRKGPPGDAEQPPGRNIHRRAGLGCRPDAGAKAGPFPCSGANRKTAPPLAGIGAPARPGLLAARRWQRL